MNREKKIAVHAICLFRIAIHFPWTEEKKTLIPYIYNASNAIEERSNWIGYISNWIIESLFELQRCQIQLESSLNQLQISLYVYD